MKSKRAKNALEMEKLKSNGKLHDNPTPQARREDSARM
jgi:hypothetical protein